MDCVKIRNLEAIFLVCVGVVNHIILFLPNVVISSTGSGAVLNITFIVLVVLLLGYFISKIFQKFPGLDILDISQFLGGKWLKWIAGIIYIVFFIFSTSLIVRTFSENLQIQYFANTPIFLIVLGFLIVAGIANFLGAKSVIRCNSIIIPIMMISLLVAFVSIIPEYVWQRIFPIAGYSWTTTFFTCSTNIFTLSGLSLLFFLPPFLEDENSISKVTMGSILLGGFLLILSIICLLFSLPFVTTTIELSPMFLIIRTAEWGNVFQRPEAIFVLIWCLSVLCYISVLTMIIHHIFRKISGVQNKKIPILFILIAIFIVALLPRSFANLYFAHYQIYRYFAIGFAVVFQLMICLLAFFKQKSKSNLNVRKE